MLWSVVPHFVLQEALAKYYHILHGRLVQRAPYDGFIVDQYFRVNEELASCISKLHPAPCSIEERYSKIFFQFLHLACQSGLSNMKF